MLADLTGYWDGLRGQGPLLASSSVWRFDDKVYNVMSYTNLLGLYYNQDALDAVGIEPPETLEEFETALEAVAADGTYTAARAVRCPDRRGGVDVHAAAARRGHRLLQPRRGRAHHRHGADPGLGARPASPHARRRPGTRPTRGRPFTSGKYAFGINGNWNLGDAAAADFTVGTTRFPAGSEGSQVFPGGEGIGIGAFAEDQDLAWQYIQDAWLSSEAGLINFEASGQIPTRSDLADDEAVTSNTLVQPFVAAAGETAAWPLNEQTAAMQTAIGQSSSAVLSGEKDAATAAAEALAGVEDAKEEGGGSC